MQDPTDGARNPAPAHAHPAAPPPGRGPGRLSRSQLRRALRLSVWDGVAFAFMVGAGESYLVADALRLGGSTTELGLVVTLPLLLGSLGPLVVLRLLGRVAHRRSLVVAFALLQVLNWAALALLDLGGGSAPGSLIAMACLHNFFGQATGAAWTSWFGDLVPAGIRGRYFGRRNRWIYVSTCLGLITGGLLLEGLEPGRGAAGDGRGFALIFGLAALARLASSLLLRATPEPRFTGLAAPVRVWRFLSTERGTRAWRLLLFSATLYFSVYVASPYFAPFMLQELRFGYAEYMLATLAIVLFKVLAVPAWGRIVDGHGALPSFALAALLTSLVPLPWLWTGGLGWAVAAQCFSGFSWAGYDVSVFSLLLETSYRGTRPHVFAVQSVLQGTAQLLGGLVGAACLAWGGQLRLVFALSLGCRLALALLVPNLLPPGPAQTRVRRPDLFLRLIGFRPSGGVAHRPLPGDEHGA